MMNRRGFLGALLALPAALKAIALAPPKPPTVKWLTPFGELEIVQQPLLGRPRNWRETILLLFPDGQSPLTTMLGGPGIGWRLRGSAAQIEANRRAYFWSGA